MKEVNVIITIIIGIAIIIISGFAASMYESSQQTPESRNMLTCQSSCEGHHIIKGRMLKWDGKICECEKQKD